MFEQAETLRAETIEATGQEDLDETYKALCRYISTASKQPSHNFMLSNDTIYSIEEKTSWIKRNEISSTAATLAVPAPFLNFNPLNKK